MGDRTWWYEDCPKCKIKESVEVYDAPSCLQFLRKCDKCGWSDGLTYYETSPSTIELLTKEEAKKRKLIYVDGLINALLKKKPNHGK